MSGLSAGQKIGRSVIAVFALGALSLQGGSAWALGWVLDNERLIKDQLVAYQFDAPDDILSYVEQAGLSEEGALYLKTSLPKVVPSMEFGRYCSRDEPGIGVLGCYTLRDGRIFLFDVTDPRLTSIEPVVAAHEMLHAVWFRLSLDTQTDLGVLLEEGFAELPADHPLRARILLYEDVNPAVRIPELYAIMGTEVSVLPAELEAHYAIYFQDRTKVVALADEVYRVFDTVEQELMALSDNLESRGAEIDGLRFTYEAESGALRSQVLAFNEKASRPGAFPSRSEFESVRAELIGRQNRLEAMRVTLQTKISEFNTLLEELNTVNDEVSELNQGINVTLRSEDELQAEDSTITE